MRTLRQAAALLSRAISADGLVAVAGAVGFDGAALALDADTRANLGIPDLAGEVRLMRGAGALRALLVRAPDGVALRPLLAQLASSLERRTSRILWTIVAAGSDDEAAVACWTSEQRAPRLALLLVRPSQVVASDAETLCALEAASTGDDLLVHTRWCELLGRDALSRRFYRTLEQRLRALAGSLPRMPEPDRAELALLCASRLLFLSFLEAKGWLDGDRAFLARQFDACMERGGAFHQRVLLPFFFGTLNTPLRRRASAARAFGAVPFLNGGLFGRTALERRHSRARFSDEALGELFAQVLGAYRFTAREEQTEWSEVAIDPEMLGRAFESLMAARERRFSGAFYTPQPLVAQVADHALAAALDSGALPTAMLEQVLRGCAVPVESARALRERLNGLAVLDPACGSGAFLVYLLERLTQLHVAAGDPRGVADIRRDVLARTIHGVDVNPTAVWLCELRLWLSVVIESDETRMSAVPPLPNLDCNVRVGDALAGEGFDEPPALVGAPAALARLRERYARASGARKVTLRRALDREESRRAIAMIDHQLRRIAAERRERVLARRSPDLFGERGHSTGQSLAARRELRERSAALRRERKRIADGGALPFSFPSHFAHVHARGGFGLVVGNPPWVRLHNIPPAARDALRPRFAVFRDAAWTPAPHETQQDPASPRRSISPRCSWSGASPSPRLAASSRFSCRRSSGARSPAVGCVRLLARAHAAAPPRGLVGRAMRDSTPPSIRRCSSRPQLPTSPPSTSRPSSPAAFAVRRRYAAAWNGRADPDAIRLDARGLGEPVAPAAPRCAPRTRPLRARRVALGASPLGRRDSRREVRVQRRIRRERRRS